MAQYFLIHVLLTMFIIVNELFVTASEVLRVNDLNWRQELMVKSDKR